MSPDRRQDTETASLRSVLQTGLGLLGGMLLAILLTLSVMDAAHLSFSGGFLTAQARPVVRIDHPRLVCVAVCRPSQTSRRLGVAASPSAMLSALKAA